MKKNMLFSLMILGLSAFASNAYGAEEAIVEQISAEDVNFLLDELPQFRVPLSNIEANNLLTLMNANRPTFDVRQMRLNRMNARRGLSLNLTTGLVAHEFSSTSLQEEMRIWHWLKQIYSLAQAQGLVQNSSSWCAIL